MRPGLYIALLGGLLLAVTGCASGFEGQWLEDGVLNADGSVVSVTGSKRLALDFNAPAVVRYGNYVNDMQVVDGTSVQSDRYFLFDGSTTAQFGAMIARREGDHLIAIVGSGGERRQFSRVRGVFPPRVILPPIS